MPVGNWPALETNVIDSSQITDLGSVTLRGDIRSFQWNGGSDLSGGADAAASAGFFLDSSAGAAQFQQIYAEGGTFTGVTIEGDFVSSNWDGANPANLASKDGSATTGFYLDSSAGAAQFMGDVWVDGTLTATDVVITSGSLGSLSVTGNLVLSGGTFATAASGARAVLAAGALNFYSTVYTNPATIWGGTTMSIVAPYSGTNDRAYVTLDSGSGVGIFFGKNGSTNAQWAIINSVAIYPQGTQGLRNVDGSASTPSYSFDSSPGGGMYYNAAADILSFTTDDGGERLLGLELSATDTSRWYLGNESNDYMEYDWGSSTEKWSLTIGSERLAVTSSTFTFNGNTIWHAGNDGAGSGLDADTLDGSSSGAFATSGHNHSGTYAALSHSHSYVSNGGSQAGSANARFSSAGNGTSFVATSTIKGKTSVSTFLDEPYPDVVPMGKRADRRVRGSVLDLTPVIFKSIHAADDQRRIYLGLIAEEAQEKFPYGYEYHPTLPGIDWNGITTGLLAEVKQQAVEIRELRKQVRQLMDREAA